METKQKTWEDCCDEVAENLYGERFAFYKMVMPFLNERDVTILNEAAKLFNQETAAERDSYKSGAEQWKATSKYQEDEINKLREENERLKELSDRWGTELLKLKDDYNSLKQLNSELLGLSYPWPLQSVLDRLIFASEHLLHDKCYDGQGYEEIERAVSRAKDIFNLISKASDGYTKAKD